MLLCCFSLSLSPSLSISLPYSCLCLPSSRISVKQKIETIFYKNRIFFKKTTNFKYNESDYFCFNSISRFTLARFASLMKADIQAKNSNVDERNSFLDSPNNEHDYTPMQAENSIKAVVHSAYKLQIRKSGAKSAPIPMQKVEIESSQIPLLIHFKSQSSKLNVKQIHRGGRGRTQKSVSEDGPDILIHEVKRPIFQQVNEIILPFRKTIQVIKPVQEQMETVVTKSSVSQNSGTYPNAENYLFDAEPIKNLLPENGNFVSSNPTKEVAKMVNNNHVEKGNSFKLAKNNFESKSNFMKNFHDEHASSKAKMVHPILFNNNRNYPHEYDNYFSSQSNMKAKHGHIVAPRTNIQRRQLSHNNLIRRVSDQSPTKGRKYQQRRTTLLDRYNL